MVIPVTGVTSHERKRLTWRQGLAQGDDTGIRSIRAGDRDAGLLDARRAEAIHEPAPPWQGSGGKKSALDMPRRENGMSTVRILCFEYLPSVVAGLYVFPGEH